MFAAGWYGFIGSCVGAMIVIDEVNNPFSQDAMDRVVKDHSVLVYGCLRRRDWGLRPHKDNDHET
ncbi:MAG: hypothetical protein ABGZ53_02140 [Fuerstiella sp.]